MSSDTSQPILSRFSTRGLPESERIPFWRARCPVADIEPQSGRPFEVDAMLLSLPGLKVGWCNSENPARWSRTAELVKDGDDDFALLISLAGRMLRSQLGRDIEIDAGDGFGVLHAEPASVRFHGLNQHLALMMPRAALSPLVADLDAASTGLVLQNNEALRLLRGYLSALRESPDIADPRLGKLIVAHVYDLVAMAIGASRDGASVAAGRGLRAARLRAIKDDFAANPALTLAALAARQHVTPRYVQMLFESEGTTFRGYALEQRLSSAHRMLTDRRHADWTISTVALEAGFGDVSHFNRSFRRRYGASPSAVRAETLRLAGEG